MGKLWRQKNFSVVSFVRVVVNRACESLLHEFFIDAPKGDPYYAEPKLTTTASRRASLRRVAIDVPGLLAFRFV
ncbi:MAG: hypothetical protein DCC66_06875 [Planctomycetota bacterium]|nr:MAG: hypothetical protein DCC66_06875 [Planctomycetota bacterium]